MAHSRNLVIVNLAVILCLLEPAYASNLHVYGSDDDNDDQYEVNADVPPPSEDELKVHAKNAHKAFESAKQAPDVANKVAEHSIKITGRAKHALTHALGALHDARVESSGLKKQQKESLKKAEAHLREATKKADYGKLKTFQHQEQDAKDKQKEDMQKNLDNGAKSQTEKEQMLEDIKELRDMLEKKGGDEDIEKALDELEASVHKSDGVTDEQKAELERLRELIEKLKGNKVQQVKKRAKGYDSSLKPLGSEEDDGETDSHREATPIEERGIDIDTQMPYGDLEPFGREDTAQELTENSIKESDEMVDQLERAEVAEEKRAVFRALTRLRGAAITSFDGVARSQTGNIDEYNQIHKWRKTHPIAHLADEESDVAKWAFPDNADFL